MFPWPRRIRCWQIVIVLGIALPGLLLVLWGRPDIRTRRVRYRGQLCTEYFNSKDGLEVRAECPSRGGEWYDDTSQARAYPSGFPVRFHGQPSNRE